MLIFLAVISTGVNLVYGGAKRIINFFKFKGNVDINRYRKINILSSGIYVILTNNNYSIGLLK